MIYEFLGVANDIDGVVNAVEYRVESGVWQTAKPRQQNGN
jgi:hypothetical protein